MTESKQGSNESFHSEKKQKQKSCKPTANIVDCGYDLGKCRALFKTCSLLYKLIAFDILILGISTVA